MNENDFMYLNYLLIKNFVLTHDKLNYINFHKIYDRIIIFFLILYENLQKNFKCI